MKVLDLVLKSQWYFMYELGIKKEEYREITPYWYLRLYQRKSEFGYAGRLTMDDAEYACDPSLRQYLREGFRDSELKPYTHVRFHRGYTKTTMLFELKGMEIGRGKPEWGAPEDRDVFILKLGERYFDVGSKVVETITGARYNVVRVDYQRDLVMLDDDLWCPMSRLEIIS